MLGRWLIPRVEETSFSINDILLSVFSLKIHCDDTHFNSSQIPYPNLTELYVPVSKKKAGQKIVDASIAAGVKCQGLHRTLFYCSVCFTLFSK